MKEKTRAVLLFFLVFYLTVPTSFPLLCAETLTLVHTNDIHGIYKPFTRLVGGHERFIGGMEALSHYLDLIRRNMPHVFIFDKGDLLTGTLAADLKYKGIYGGVMIEFLNLLGYDLWCFGNHDFDRGKDNVLKLAGAARFPAVSANIVYEENGRLFFPHPYKILSAGNLQVGVIGVMEDHFLKEVSREMTRGLAVVPSIEALKKYVVELETETDIIVVLYHGWFKEGVEIARQVPHIDVVLVASEDGKFENVDGVLVQSTIGHLETMGLLKLEVENGEIVSYEPELIRLWADVPLEPSAEVKAFVQEIEGKIDKEYEIVIGRAEKDMSRRGNMKENPLGNWIADALCWKCGSQIGLINSGAVRADIKKGPITKADIFHVSPFHNTVVVFRLNGRQLRAALEFDIEKEYDRIQVSGLKYSYFSKNDKPFGNRIEKLTVGEELVVDAGKILLPDRLFKVASIDYLAEHAEDKYFGFPIEKIESSSASLCQVLTEWLKTFKKLDYGIEGRIVLLKSKF
ncbi:MAG: bifunctional metallophosphatase/5'-nucleotidase [Candidatus Aminicenantes bacterium]|nr:bifunctional metallophosphatase/5'-nucleotidase [Candidatus Aminicenantes bacterium]